MIDINGIQLFLTECCEQYEKSAPTVDAYCNDLYIRINENPASVSLFELLKIQLLKDSNIWMNPNVAANYVYHLETELGRSTVGHIGF